MRYRCKACGKEYNFKPGRCEDDGLDDFDVIDTDKGGAWIYISDNKELFRIEIEKTSYDLLEFDPLKKFIYSFNPAGTEFPVKLPLNTLFSPGDVTMNISDDGESLKIQVALKVLLSHVRIRRVEEDVPVTLDSTKYSSGDYFSYEIRNNEEIIFNGLTIKYLT